MNSYQCLTVRTQTTTAKMTREQRLQGNSLTLTVASVETDRKEDVFGQKIKINFSHMFR